MTYLLQRLSGPDGPLRSVWDFVRRAGARAERSRSGRGARGGSGRRAGRLFDVVPLLVACVGAPAAAQEPPGDEHVLKAAFIFNFAQFTQWPDGVWAAEGADLVLCTAGSDGVVSALQELAGRSVKGHPIAVRALGEKQGAANCQVLYIAASRLAESAAIVEKVRTRPVLTISERDPAAGSAAIIQFFHEEQRLRFTIDRDVARRTGLELNSRMLNLAVVTGDRKAR